MKPLTFMHKKICIRGCKSKLCMSFFFNDCFIMQIFHPSLPSLHYSIQNPELTCYRVALTNGAVIQYGLWTRSSLTITVPDMYHYFHVHAII